MKITCGSCSAKYTVSDDKVHGKTVKVKCRKCGAVIVVSSTGEVQTTGATAGGAASMGAASGGLTYTVSVSDTDQRSLTVVQIVDAYNEGIIDAETYVWAEGMDDWAPLKDVDAIVDALHDAAAQEGSGELGQTVAMQDPGGYGGPAPASYPPAGSYPPAAAAQGLGGTVAMAQSPLASPGGGFFAAPAGGGAFGGSSFTDVAHGPAPGGNGTPRTEDSAIFSLNMLTAKVGGAAPSTPSTTSEDSGLIDLKALAQGMNEPAPGPASHGASALASDGLFPLGAPPPQALAPSASASVAPAAGGAGRGLILGLAALVVVMGAALMFILVRDSGPQPTTPTTTPEPTTPPTPTLAETPPEPAPKPSALASASASASAGPKLAGGRPIPRPTGGPRPQPGASPSPKAAPKGGGTGGPCGCASDDLMCHMRCSQKKK